MGLSATLRSEESNWDLYLVDVAHLSAGELAKHRKLSPALVVTEESDGVLKGSDPKGQPVLALPSSTAEELRKKYWIHKLDSSHVDWRPVTQLKLSYDAGGRPGEEELRTLGLHVIEDYKKGLFVIVEPLDKKIDSELLVRIETYSKVLHVTPLFQIRAVSL